MIILASDYDRTLKTRIHDLKININELRKFMMLGNTFILATGRPFFSIKKEIETFNIPLNYLTCNDGAVSFDSSLNVINAHLLDNNQVTDIIAVAKEHSEVKVGNFYSPTEAIDSTQDLIEIELLKEKKASFKKIIKSLDLNIPGLSHFVWHNSLFVKKDTSKSESIIEIVRTFEEEINFEDIYAIGDERNDIDMLKRFNGYRMLEANPSLWFATGFKIVPEAHHLIKYLNYKSRKASK